MTQPMTQPMTHRALKSVYLLLVTATTAALAFFLTTFIFRSYAQLQIMDAVAREGRLASLPAPASMYGAIFGSSIPRGVVIVSALFVLTSIVTLALSARLRARGEPFKIFDPLVMLFFGAGFFAMGTIAGLMRYQTFRASAAQHDVSLAFNNGVSQEIRDFIGNNQQAALIFAGFGAVLAIVSMLRAIQQFRNWGRELEFESRKGRPSRFDHLPM